MLERTARSAELDEATGMYYYGARYYDPRISIFISVDPLAEQFVGWTPYHYVHNNPVNMIDPTGMSAEWIPDNEGNLIAEKGDNTRTLAEYLGKNFKVNGKSILVMTTNLKKDEKQNLTTM